MNPARTNSLPTRESSAPEDNDKAVGCSPEYNGTIIATPAVLRTESKEGPQYMMLPSMNESSLSNNHRAFMEELFTGESRIKHRYNSILHLFGIERENPKRIRASGEEVRRAQNSEKANPPENIDMPALNLPHPPSYLAVKNIYIEAAALLLSAIEQCALGDEQPNEDVAATVRRKDLSAAMIFIRPESSGDKLQLAMAFGNRRWKKRGSIHAACVCVTMPWQCDEGPWRDIDAVDISCTCADFIKSRGCNHRSALLDDGAVRMRLASIMSRKVHPLYRVGGHNDWEVMKYPWEDGDDATLYHVYQRASLSSVFRTSVCVLVDDRRNRRSMNIKFRVRCLSCRAFAENRGLCCHEKALINNLQAARETIAEGNEHDNVTSESGEVHLDTASVDGQIENNEEGDNDQRGTIGSEPIDYCSKMPRFFFACPEDERGLIRILNGIRKAASPSEGGPYRLTCIDAQVLCPHCSVILRGTEVVERYRRVTTLHTLHHGSVDIEVIDLRCTSCLRIIPYDGMSDSLFCSNNKHAFTRELLDAWLWDVCGTGGSFRDAFSSWAAKSVSTSTALHIIGKPPDLNRQRANDAFTQFLMTLRFPSDSDAADLFSCSNCEGAAHDGVQRMDAIVMDGTAMGILGTLPQFERVSETIDPVYGIEKLQYIMPTPIYRAFVDSIFIAAKKSDGDLLFDVKMAPKLWAKIDFLTRKFFNNKDGLEDEAYAVAVYLSTCYYLCQGPDEEDNTEDFCEYSWDEEVPFSGRLRLRNRFKDFNLRRIIFDFGRCFLSGSIAGGSLRNHESTAKAIALASSLTAFSKCAHEIYNVLASAVCHDCALRLLICSRDCVILIPSAAGIARCIAEAAALRKESYLRVLAQCVASVLHRAVDVRSNFFLKFDERSKNDIRSYNARHRHGTTEMPVPCNNWLDEAARTGELFPGRPEVRPRIDFGRDGRSRENTRNCRKLYTKSETHSPGIFTVQCACRNPKLLGLSVMMQCEGVSTALSVLLSRFKRLPQVCYYDNACNMAKSIVLRVPWVNDDCIIACDRFHYRGHTCNSIADPDSYILCDDQSSSGAEAINHLWSFSKSHFRFLNAKNLMPFLAARSVFINVRALLRQEEGKTEIDVRTYRKFIHKKWKCSCHRCNIAE